MKPYLYCLMEVGTREFFARCLTSCIAAERGFTVLLGYQYTLLEHAPILPPGIYFSKGTNSIAVSNMIMTKEYDHMTAACEEENFFRVLENSPIVCSDDTLPKGCDLFLAMGREEQKHIQGRFGDALSVSRCGNARTDVLRPELRPLFETQVRELKNKFGNYILINSNLGIINSGVENKSPQEIFRNWTDAGLFDPTLDTNQRRAIFQDYIEFEEGNALALRGLLTKLAQRDFTVLVRPHPGEKRSTWDDIVNGLGAPHIQIMKEGSHIPAILAAELVIHTACTTGVEAVLVGTPSLGIRSTDAKAHEYYLANSFNVTCSSPDEAMVLVDRHMAGDSSIRDARPDLMDGISEYLDALNVGPLAADRIVDAFVELAARIPDGVNPMIQSRTGELKILGESEHYSSDPYMRQKLGMGPDLVFETIESYKRILGRFDSIKCQQQSESVFKFSK